MVQPPDSRGENRFRTRDRRYVSWEEYLEDEIKFRLQKDPGMGRELAEWNARHAAVGKYDMPEPAGDQPRRADDIDPAFVLDPTTDKASKADGTLTTGTTSAPTGTLMIGTTSTPKPALKPDTISEPVNSSHIQGRTKPAFPLAQTPMPKPVLEPSGPSAQPQNPGKPVGFENSKVRSSQNKPSKPPSDSPFGFWECMDKNARPGELRTWHWRARTTEIVESKTKALDFSELRRMEKPTRPQFPINPNSYGSRAAQAGRGDVDISSDKLGKQPMETNNIDMFLPLPELLIKWLVANTKVGNAYNISQFLRSNVGWRPVRDPAPGLILSHPSRQNSIQASVDEIMEFRSEKTVELEVLDSYVRHLVGTGGRHINTLKKYLDYSIEMLSPDTKGDPIKPTKTKIIFIYIGNVPDLKEIAKILETCTSWAKRIITNPVSHTWRSVAVMHVLPIPLIMFQREQFNIALTDKINEISSLQYWILLDYKADVEAFDVPGFVSAELYTLDTEVDELAGKLIEKIDFFVCGFYKDFMEKYTKSGKKQHPALYIPPSLRSVYPTSSRELTSTEPLSKDHWSQENFKIEEEKRRLEREALAAETEESKPKETVVDQVFKQAKLNEKGERESVTSVSHSQIILNPGEKEKAEPATSKPLEETSSAQPKKDSWADLTADFGRIGLKKDRSMSM